MIPQCRLVINLSTRSSLVLGSMQRMATNAPATAAPNPCARHNIDRTWKSSQGIAFSSPKKPTWSPQCGVQFSSSGTSPTHSLVPPLADIAEKSLENSTIPLPAAHHICGNRANLQPSRCTEQPKVLMESPLGLPTQDAAFYPLLDSSLLAQEIGMSELDGRSQSPQENSNPHAPSAPGYEPFRSPLGFHIPETKFKIAMDASPPSAAAYWQHTLYRGPGGDKDTVKVHYCKNKETTETIAKHFLDEGLIGFDLEWKVNPKDDSIKKNVALVQVASERRIALFHLARFPNALKEEDFITPSLRKLMESPNITKVGVNVKGDSTRLRKYLHIECQGLFELSHLYKLIKFSTGDVKKINKKLVSLASQVHEHFQLPLWKGEVRSSDWSQELSYQQTQYAASDSYAGLQLFYVLESKRQALVPTPPRPAHAELNLPIRLADGQTVATVDEIPEITDEVEGEADHGTEVSVQELSRDIQAIDLGDSSLHLDSDFSLVPDAPPEASSTSRSSSRIPDGESVSLPPSPELRIANTWVEQFVKARSPPTTKPYAKPAELRAYALWHGQSLDIPFVAKLLRNPPLQNATVAGYIGKAIGSEMLPYDSARVPQLQVYATRLPLALCKRTKELDDDDDK